MQANATELHKARVPSSVVARDFRYWIVLSSPRASRRQTHRGSPSPSGHHRLEMVVKQGVINEQLLVERASFGQTVQPYYSISAALSSLDAPNGTTQVFLAPRERLNQGFIINVLRRGKLCEIADKPNLADLLERRDGASNLLLPERVNICCSLIEGCFRFLGSAWLDKLDAERLKCGIGSGDSWAIMLGDGIGNDLVSQGLQEMQNAARNGRDHRDLSTHCQIFRLGLIMTELALKTYVTSIETNPSRTEAQVVIQSIQNESLSASEIAGFVETATNSKMIGDAIYFCLSTLQAPRLPSNDEIGERFFYQVVQKYVTPWDCVQRATANNDFHRTTTISSTLIQRPH
jgi:hypothetical protein